MVSVSSEPNPEASSGRRLSPAAHSERILRVLMWILYAGFVVLWFKDNIDPLKKFRLSYFVAFVPLVAVIGLRIIRAFRMRKIVLRFKFDKTVLAIVLLVVLATAVRWPYISYGERLVNGDDGISALMGKHIAEGKVPPICFYGQRYLGSLPNHFYALFFLVFGYSILVLKVATFLFYIVFIIVQFLLLRDVFSWTFAVFVSLLYSLPFGQLLLVSVDNSSAYGLVLFLGCTVLFIATKIAYENKASRLPALGFVMGLAFWTHPITMAFILTSVLIVLIKARSKLKAMLTLTVYGALSMLPFLFQEVFDRFEIVQFLGGGEKGPFTSAKVKATVQNLKSLLAPLDENKLGTILSVVLILGALALLWMAIRSKGRSPVLIFLVFLVVFGGMHWFSRFSDKFVARYLYPSYVVLPVLLLSPFYLLKSRVKTIFMAGFVAAVVILNGWPVHVSYTADVRRESVALRQVVQAMRSTGARYWLADYWEAYALTAISGENPIVGTTYTSRYDPYQLAIYDKGNHPCLLFLRSHRDAEHFEKLLTTLGVVFRRQNVGDASLFYDIGSPVYPEVFYENAPSSIPGIKLNGLRERDGFLEISFQTEDAGPHAHFGLSVEVPGYSRITTNIPDEARSFPVKVPAPPRKTISIRYGLNFRGLEIASTSREISFTCADAGPSERTEDVVFLRGIGPLITRAGRSGYDCAQEAVMEIRPPRSQGGRLRLTVFNSIDFRRLNWYGRYVQAVKVSVAGRPAEEISLPSENNVIDVSLGEARSNGTPTAVTLAFRYSYALDKVPDRTLSAFLEKIEILD